jgi:hypothetical protein
MACEQKSFETLLEEAPSAPSPGTVSVVGILGQSTEAGKFVLTLADGRAITLETASVKSCAPLGTSVGQTIVRVDLDTAKIPTFEPAPQPWRDPVPEAWRLPAGGVTPFALATPHQARVFAPPGGGGPIKPVYDPIGITTYFPGYGNYNDHKAIFDSTGNPFHFPD